jgi:predicted RNA-binding Zn ribbon-like protein
MVVRRDVVRFGGEQGPDGFRFELSGGRLCLDFVNTVDERTSREPRELVPTYPDLVSWSTQSGILSPKAAERLLRTARRDPERARRALARARSLREVLFAIFSSAAAGRPAPSPALRALDTELKKAFARPSLRTGTGYRLDWQDPEAALDRMLGPVIRSTVELLTSPGVDRVRICEAGGCGWLFFDASRNRSRQWCDMTVCGNRAKARRFYERRRRHGGRRRGSRMPSASR